MENNNFDIGKCVVYGSNGICLIESIKNMDFAGREQEYYILKQVGKSGSVIYVPTENEVLVAKMRYLMSKNEIDALLCEIKEIELEWIADRKKRFNYFNDIISKGIEKDLLLMIRCIYAKKRELLQNKKKLSGSDEGLLQNAQRIVREEFSFSLKIAQEDVTRYIQNSIDNAV